jgi:hypothetical protein
VLGAAPEAMAPCIGDRSRQSCCRALVLVYSTDPRGAAVRGALTQWRYPRGADPGAGRGQAATSADESTRAALQQLRAAGVGRKHRAQLSEPAVTDRQGIGFGWLQNAWLLHARLKIHRGGLIPVCGQHRKPAGRFTEVLPGVTPIPRYPDRFRGVACKLDLARTSQLFF